MDLLVTDSCRGTVPMEPPMSNRSMRHENPDLDFDDTRIRILQGASCTIAACDARISGSDPLALALYAISIAYFQTKKVNLACIPEMPELSIGPAWRWEHGAGERQLARRLRVLCRKIAPHTAAAGGSASSTAAAAALGAEGFAVRQLEGRGLAAEVLFPDALPVRGDRCYARCRFVESRWLAVFAFSTYRY
jgi:hypothetical protein